ncbi:hypothetical protein FHX74_001500 [Friedmanniella endophytica]|uniref:Uncharacterized protein n=1 Tax=Microlunatus kandeliicorticis TaxID=1759536 RepID=A0A7W3IRJ6_9ACTN|nr:hypothetical protein [Microlunatus kandeliicorticis]MBA8793895.1 hypothetical protein [Microlunatus kandeliicorticis]
MHANDEAGRGQRPSTDPGPDREGVDLDRICAELNVDRGTARGFIRDYLALLPARIERIGRELDVIEAAGNAAQTPGQPLQLNVDPAVVALLSLDSSSVMLGAHEVSLAAQALRRDLQVGRLAGVEEGRRALVTAADRVRDRLLDALTD